jgi:tRNA-binding protein
MTHNDTEIIEFADFMRVDIRTGTITDVQPFERARKPAWQLTIDFGAEIGTKRSSAQITHHYQPLDLIGTQVLAVVNFPPKQIANFISEVLVLGVADDAENIVLLQPRTAVPNGQRMY